MIRHLMQRGLMIRLLSATSTLDAPGVSATESWYVRLTFQHNFNLEASELDPNLGFDGGVLELSMDGGNTFQDITVGGNVFEAGGYNRTIATNRGSPIAGRAAWSGNSEGFITTVVNLPSELLNAVAALANGER